MQFLNTSSLTRCRSRHLSHQVIFSRRFLHSTPCCLSSKSSTNSDLVLGIYESSSSSSPHSNKPQDVESTSAFSTLPNQVKEAIRHQIKSSEVKGKLGDVRVFYGVSGNANKVSTEENQVAEGLPKIRNVAVVGLGKKEESDTWKLMERCRKAAAIGVKALKENGSTRIFVDPLSSPHSTAEGSFLSTYQYTTFKNPKSVRPLPEIIPFSPPANVSENSSSNSKNNYNWQTGKVYADSQNFARELMETPANHLTPRIFCETVTKKFEELSLDSSMLKLTVRDEQWIQKNGLNAFWAVAKGSAEPPRLLEIEYNGTGVNNADKTVALVGKGVTFDSGGISIKPSAGMASMKGDMGGAATVVSTLYGIAKLKHPISVRGFIPLCENMPDGRATKPGDVVKALNGMSIEIDNTDAEGRLILADALYYARSTYNPHTIIDVATLTGAIDVALGPLYTGLFSTSSRLAEELVDAGNRTHDKFWRMPMDEEYRKLMKSVTADIKNVGNRSGGACTAAIFLKQFLTPAVEKGEYGKVTENNGASDKNEEELRYAHLDIAGTMESAASDGYHVKGMSGRPTRSLIDFLRHYKDIQV